MSGLLKVNKVPVLHPRYSLPGSLATSEGANKAYWTSTAYLYPTPSNHYWAHSEYLQTPESEGANKAGWCGTENMLTEIQVKDDKTKLRKLKVLKLLLKLVHGVNNIWVDIRFWLVGQLFEMSKKLAV